MKQGKSPTLSRRLLSRLSAGMIRCAAKADPSGFAHAMLLEIAARRPDTLSAFVTEKATELATAIMIASWDKQGIRHCAACPERFSLRRRGQFWLCTRHDKEVAAPAAV